MGRAFATSLHTRPGWAAHAAAQPGRPAIFQRREGGVAGDAIVGQLILEPNGDPDERADMKEVAAKRRCEAVTAEGSYRPWTVAMIRGSMATVPDAVSAATAALAGVG